MKVKRHLCWERAQQQLKTQRLECNKLSWTRAMAHKKSLNVSSISIFNKHLAYHYLQQVISVQFLVHLQLLYHHRWQSRYLGQEHSRAMFDFQHQNRETLLRHVILDLLLRNKTKILSTFLTLNLMALLTLRVCLRHTLLF